MSLSKFKSNMNLGNTKSRIMSEKSKSEGAQPGANLKSSRVLEDSEEDLGSPVNKDQELDEEENVEAQLLSKRLFPQSPITPKTSSATSSDGPIMTTKKTKQKN